MAHCLEFGRFLKLDLDLDLGPKIIVTWIIRCAFLSCTLVQSTKARSKSNTFKKMFKLFYQYTKFEENLSNFFSNHLELITPDAGQQLFQIFVNDRQSSKQMKKKFLCYSIFFKILQKCMKKIIHMHVKIFCCWHCSSYTIIYNNRILRSQKTDKQTMVILIKIFSL